MKRLLWIVLLLGGFLLIYAGQRDGLCIVSYNVENFFDYEHDSLKNDLDFTPQGQYRWSKTRFYRKAEQISRVLVNIGGLYPPAIVGLCEVENARCMELLCRKLHHYNYQYLLYEGLDRRGIDVGLLYDTLQLTLLHSEPIRIFLDSTLLTRDVLYAAFEIYQSRDTLHLFMCHMPSQRGGAKQSEWKRDSAKSVIRSLTHNILTRNPQAQIVVMGDMNTTPKEDLLPLTNSMLAYNNKDLGTHRYHGIWTCLDQAYISPSLAPKTTVSIYDADWLLEYDKKYLGFSPYRTFNGFHYRRNGFSDHLPIIIQIR